MNPPYRLIDQATGATVFEDMDTEPGEYIEVYAGQSPGNPDTRISDGAVQRPDDNPDPPDPPDPPMPDSDFQKALQAALDAGTVLHLNADITIDAPVAVKINSSQIGWFGLDGGMHKIRSNVGNGPAIRFYMDDSVAQGVCARGFFCGNLGMIGSGNESALIQADVPFNDRWLVNPEFRSLWLEGSGGDGIVLRGSIFEGNLYSVGTMNCKGNGAVLAQAGPDNNKGVLSAMRWYGGTHRQNMGHGILYEDYGGPHDVRLYGLYFCENHKNGINALCGLELVDGCGFENNGADIDNPAAIYAENFCYLRKCTGSTHGTQPWLLRGYVVGEFSLDTCSVAGYGGGNPQIANLTGQGSVRLVGTDQRLCQISGPTVNVGV
jgi:hypothetical protein